METNETETKRPMYIRRVVYNPATREYDLYLDGELVGSAFTPKLANSRIDQLIVDGIRAELRKMIPDFDRLIAVY